MVKAQQEPQVQQDQVGVKVLQVLKVYKAHKVLKAQLVVQEPQVQ